MEIKKFPVVMRLCVCLTLGVGALAACGDDDGGSAPDASVVADAGGDGGDVDAGVDLGVADLGPLEAGALDLGEADAGTSDGGAPDCTPTHLLVTTSDFVTGGLATYALDTGTIALAPAPTADQDTLPVRAGCDTYLVEGGTGAGGRPRPVE